MGKSAFNSNFMDCIIGVRSVNKNFLYRMRQIKIKKYMVFDSDFKEIIDRLIAAQYIDHHSYHMKNNTVRGYFNITKLGSSYLDFLKL